MTKHQRRRYTTGAKIFLAVYALALVAAMQLMKSQFIKAGLSRDYPFNNADNSYYVECIDGLIHTNKNRIAWVKREWQHYV